MNKEEHRQCHVVLHKALDELVADFINHTDGRPSTTPVLALMQWAHQQTIEPTEEHEASGGNGGGKKASDAKS